MNYRKSASELDYDNRDFSFRPTTLNFRSNQDRRHICRGRTHPCPFFIGTAIFIFHLTEFFIPNRQEQDGFSKQLPASISNL